MPNKVRNVYFCLHGSAIKFLKLKIFKFGGAAVSDAENIRNVADIVLSSMDSNQQLILVISAMGKTTNQLEVLAKSVVQNRGGALEVLGEIMDRHIEVCHDLKMPLDHIVFLEIESIRSEMEEFISKSESTDYNYCYDQIVSHGEILSTTILFHFLKSSNIAIAFVNARDLIRTDQNYTDANIDWKQTATSVNRVLEEVRAPVIITQGFIGGDSEMNYTTLGREGSDYTAAILAHCTHTRELTIWKDVDGVYTADPKKFPEATIIPKLSYKEAIEMTFYGAQIIHPKTIKPIQNSNCILKVKSFIHKNELGTEIGNFDPIDYRPVVVLKENQVLYTFSVRDFSFLNETNLGKIIAAFGKYSLRINLMQNTAIEFLVVTDEKLGKNELIIQELRDQFEIGVKTHLRLLTIRHYTEEILQKQRENRDVMITQKGENTILYLMK